MQDIKPDNKNYFLAQKTNKVARVLEGFHNFYYTFYQVRIN